MLHRTGWYCPGRKDGLWCHCEPRRCPVYQDCIQHGKLDWIPLPSSIYALIFDVLTFKDTTETKRLETRLQISVHSQNIVPRHPLIASNQYLRWYLSTHYKIWPVTLKAGLLWNKYFFSEFSIQCCFSISGELALYTKHSAQFGWSLFTGLSCTFGHGCCSSS